MNINEKIFGFAVDRIRQLPELQGELIEMTHEKTGLKLAWIKRDEENKTFGIAFETLPFDDTGVFHILEHSVLCGSKKYPVKEPFVSLLQTSMNTFLNAMTFPDKTLYPISSRNDKDFFNLMSVYLDAVFCPAIYEKSEIFRQEGWHYEPDENGNFTYKGVVFNEMKGVFASADELAEMAINRALFPDSPYKYVSGGDPSHIPELTYDKFIETHKKFYSPSNAYVYFDGNVDIEKALAFLDEEYLSKYEKTERIPVPNRQTPVDGGTVNVCYELGEDETDENKTRISWASTAGSFDDREKVAAVQILADVLCGSNQSILTKEVLSKNLAEDVSMQVYDGVFEPWVKIEARNIEDGKEDEIETLIFDTLRSLSENGIDRSQLEATMANFEFGMRERDYGSMPLGIAHGFLLLGSWLYGGDPILFLETGDLFVKLKEKMNEGYFENILKEVILENKHKAKIVLTPSRGEGEKRRAAEKQRIESETANWTTEDKNKIVEIYENLINWQNSEDSPKDLATLPKLALSDISVKPERIETDTLCQNGITAVYHNINCSGILNFNLYFDADDLTETEICELSFLSDIMGKMKTEKHGEEELDRLNRLIFGSLGFSVASFHMKNRADKCKIKFAVQFSILDNNADKAFPFVAELLTESNFDCEETAYNIIKQLSTDYFQNIVMSGASIGMNRVSAQNTSFGVARDCSGGYEYYKWLCRNEKNWNWDELKAKLRNLLDKIVVKNRLTVTLSSENRERLLEACDFFEKSLPDGDGATECCNIKPKGIRKEGIIIPADISFACAGGIIPDFNGYHGSMSVTSKIISLVYLWNAVRVRGGAYGTGFSINTDGLAATYSYRDPDAAGSLVAYGNMADFVNEFCAENDDISGYIIGALSGTLPLRTPKSKGYKADDDYFSEKTYEDKEKLLKEILNTTTDDLKADAEKIREIFDGFGTCIIGGRNQIDKLSLDVVETL